jgi:hypothetical protein
MNPFQLTFRAGVAFGCLWLVTALPHRRATARDARGERPAAAASVGTSERAPALRPAPASACVIPLPAAPLPLRSPL